MTLTEINAILVIIPAFGLGLIIGVSLERSRVRARERRLRAWSAPRLYQEQDEFDPDEGAA